MTTLDQEQLYSQRCLAVKLRQEKGLSFTEIGRRLGHSRQWVSRWCHRDDLSGRSCRPHHSPHQTDPGMEARVVALAQATGWGRHRLRRQLAWQLREEPEQLPHLPSPSGIERIRQRQGLAPKKQPRSPRPPPREYGAPNDLWQGDIMADTLAQGQPVMTYKLVDCASRLELLSYSAPCLDTEQIIGGVLAAFATFGLPKGVQHDNGTQFCNTQYPEMPGKLDLVLSHLGVTSQHIPPGQPQENGVVERLVRTTREEGVLGASSQDLAGYRQKQARFQEFYNQQRCHTSSGQPPVYGYQPSPRRLPQDFDLAQVKDAGWVATRKIATNGCVRIRNQEYSVGRAYAHRTAIVELRDGQAQIRIKNQIVKVLTLRPLGLRGYIGPCTIARYRTD